MSYQTLVADFDKGICRVRLDRLDAQNAINEQMIAELDMVMARCEGQSPSQEEGGTHSPVSILILEGAPAVFCAGGDFVATAAAHEVADPEPLYRLWQRMATGPFISIALVRGRVNAGGIGFVAAADIVLADRSASFSLSELLFGIFPACVLPFLVRRIGQQKAHYMTLMTRPFLAEEALASGLVDALDDDAEALLRRHLLRLQRLSQPSIRRYKAYLADLAGWQLAEAKPAALAANRSVFADPEVQHNIRRYVRDGKFPWES
jgi:polyketide biosynthesis enoyl-CoA hydratase PksH